MVLPRLESAMQMRTDERLRRAFTLIELLTVVAILMVLATLMLPVLAKTKSRSLQLECLSQLRQLGVGFIAYSHEHGDRFPYEVPVKDGGTRELLSAAGRGEDVFFAFRHFQAISNDVNEPKVFRCPVDFRTPAETMAKLKNENVSYFLSITAEPSRPLSLLAGDRNIVEPGAEAGAILKFSATSKPQWTREGHEFKGNLLFAGGHVERTGNDGLRAAMRNPTGPVSVWVPVAAAPVAQSRNSAPAPAPSSESQRGFAMLENFFHSSSRSSGSAAPSSASGTPQARDGAAVPGNRVPLARVETPAESALPDSGLPRATNRAAVASIPRGEQMASHEFESPAEPATSPIPDPLMVLIEPERCWWCWWLILGACVLAAILLGALVFRQRLAKKREQEAWRPAWEVPQPRGRR